MHGKSTQQDYRKRNHSKCQGKQAKQLSVFPKLLHIAKTEKVLLQFATPRPTLHMCSRI